MRYISAALKNRYRRFRTKGYSASKSFQLAKNLAVLRKLRQASVLTAREAFEVVKERELFRTLRSAVARSLKEKRKSLQAWTPERQRFVLTAFISFTEPQLPFFSLGPADKNFYFGKFVKKFAAHFSNLSAAGQKKPMHVLKVVDQSIAEMLGRPFLVEPSLSDLESIQSVSKLAPGSLVHFARPWQGHYFYEKAALRVFREGTQNRIETQKQLVDLFLKEVIIPTVVQKQYNMNRRGIPASIEQFLQETYRDWNRKPESVRERLRQEFESNLMATFALQFARKKAKMRYDVQLETLDKQKTHREIMKREFQLRANREGLKRIEQEEQVEKEQRRIAGFVLNLLYAPTLARYAVRQVPVLFCDSSIFHRQ